MATDDLPQGPVAQALGTDSDCVLPQTAPMRALTPVETPSAANARERAEPVDGAPGAGDRKRRRHGQRLRVIREEIENLVATNRHDGTEVYAGFRFVRRVREIASHEQPYLDAFLPLKVAQRHPALLNIQTLDVEEVFANEKLRAGTRVVARPGRFRTLRRACVACYAGRRTLNRFIWLAAFVLVAIVAAAVARWPIDVAQWLK